MDSQCDKLMTVVGHQFNTPTVDICVQHGGPEAPRRAGLSVAVEICLKSVIRFRSRLCRFIRNIELIIGTYMHVLLWKERIHELEEQTIAAWRGLLV